MKTVHRIVAFHFFLSLGTWFLGSYPFLVGGARHVVSTLSREIFMIINYPGAFAIRAWYPGPVFDLTPIIIAYAFGWVLLTEWSVLILAYVFNRYVTVIKNPRR